MICEERGTSQQEFRPLANQFSSSDPCVVDRIAAGERYRKRSSRYYYDYDRARFLATRPSRFVWDFLCDQVADVFGRNWWTIPDLAIALNATVDAVTTELRHLEKYGLAIKAKDKNEWSIVR